MPLVSVNLDGRLETQYLDFFPMVLVDRMRTASSFKSVSCWVNRSLAGAGSSSLSKKPTPLRPKRSLHCGNFSSCWPPSSR
jgi:hypothetical protein